MEEKLREGTEFRNGDELIIAAGPLAQHERETAYVKDAPDENTVVSFANFVESPNLEVATSLDYQKIPEAVGLLMVDMRENEMAA